MDGYRLLFGSLECVQWRGHVELDNIGAFDLQVVQLGDGASTRSCDDLVATSESSLCKFTTEAGAAGLLA